MTEIIVQILLAAVGVGTFVGTTKHALSSMEKRLDKMEQLGYTIVDRLSTLETELKRK